LLAATQEFAQVTHITYNPVAYLLLEDLADGPLLLDFLKICAMPPPPPVWVVIFWEETMGYLGTQSYYTFFCETKQI